MGQLCLQGGMENLQYNRTNIKYIKKRTKLNIPNVKEISTSGIYPMIMDFIFYTEEHADDDQASTLMIPKNARMIKRRSTLVKGYRCV